MRGVGEVRIKSVGVGVRVGRISGLSGIEGMRCVPSG